jgi:hypothetical protein
MRKRTVSTGLPVALSLLACVGIAGAQPADRNTPDSGSLKPSVNAKADSKDDEIASLKKSLQEQSRLIRQLTLRIDKLERERNNGAPSAASSAPAPTAAPSPGEAASEEPPIPPVEIPGESSGTPETPAAPAPGDETPPIPEVQIPETGPSSDTSAESGQPSARASLTPDISVIGNNTGRLISVHGDPNRNRFQLGEFEIGLQQPVYTGIRFDAFLSAEAEDDFKIGAEEAYATFSHALGLPVGAYLGLKRLDFGKLNPTHPHTWSFIDTPAVVSNFLGGDGLNGNGASFNYLLPTKNLFANLELGLWQVKPGDQGVNRGVGPAAQLYPLGLGVNNNFPLARLWTSKEFGPSSELQIGASDGFGKGDNGDRINLSGVDFTFTHYPGTFKRFLLQGEAMWHDRKDAFGGTGGHLRSGQYLLLTYRPNQYREFGLRLDNSQYPWPISGHDRSASLIYTNRLSEGTLARIQYKYGDRTSDVDLPAQRGYNELLLQFIWAAGSHTHPLQ